MDDDCSRNALCVDGACHRCDVTDEGDLDPAVHDAKDGEILSICPGTYAGAIPFYTSITLIGAGGGEGRNDTIIQGGSGGTVLVIFAGTEDQPVTLRGLRSRNANRGILIESGSHLTMRTCTVAGSTAWAGVVNSGTLVMTGCTVEDNNGPCILDGGGLTTYEGRRR